MAAIMSVDKKGKRREARERAVQFLLQHEMNPPESLMDFNEGDFEHSAREAHARWGDASPTNLNLLLQFHGFREQ